MIDSAVVENGDYGWPQPYSGGKSVGGFDRTELYQDPFTGAIYISAHGAGGPYPTKDNPVVNNHAGIIFVWNDNTKNWETIHKFIGEDEDKGSAPYLMTSTSKHPLIVLQILGNIPTLYWLEKGANDLSAGKSVALVENKSIIKAQYDPKVLLASPASIARIETTGSRDQVWIAYPTLNGNNRQVYRICAVTFGGAQDPAVEPVVTIQAEDPTSTSAVLGVFVQDDRVDKQVSNPDNLTLFYWIDAPPQDAPNPNNLLARYKMLFGVKGQFQSGYLSVASGQRRPFDRTAFGDYLKGGFFDWNGKVNFLAQRNEPPIKGNVVSLVP